MAGCCRSKSTCIMYTVNLLLLLLGIALTVVAALVKTHRSDLIEKTDISASEIDAVMPADDVNVALAGGCLLMVVALVGVCGARMYEGACGKTLLCLYSLFMLVVIILEFVAFIAVIVLTGTLDDYSSDVANNKNVKQLDEQIQKFINATRCSCCQKDWALGCGANAGKFNGNDACNLIKDITEVEANCASNDAFTKPMVDWINKRLRAVGIFSLVVALIQMCTLCASCCLLCRGKKKQQDNFQPAGPGAYQNPQPVGSGVAGGQPVSYA